MMSRVRDYARIAVFAALVMAVAGPIAAAQPDANEALRQAIIGGDLKAVKQAIAQGADVNYGGADPLYIAVGGNRFDIVKFLVDAGANINGIEKTGYTATPLRLAIREGNRTGDYRMMDYLLSLGADVAVGGVRMHSPLTAAARTARLAQVKKIVESGKANFEYKEWLFKPGDGKGKTALMIAADLGFAEIVAYLVEKGAKINNQHQCGWTALYYAANRGHVRILKYLLGKGASVEPEVEPACGAPEPILRNTDNEEVIQLLLKAGAPDLRYIPTPRGPYQ